MKKILFVLLFGVSLIMPKSDYKEYENIQTSFDDSVEIDVIVNDSEKSFSKESSEYYSILFEFKQLIYGSYEMPALGVSVDEWTREEMKSGVWLEFEFASVAYNNELPFDALLIKVEEESGGFNVIRRYEGKYEGRCFYISLVDTTTRNLYYYLIRL